MTKEVKKYLKYANLQMASEALLDRIPQVGLEKVLTEGNNRSSRFTQTQADQFIADGWTVVEHRRNTATGFSGTLFKYTGETDQSKELIKNQLVLSFRSTEFIDDAARDNKATNELEIKETGFAWGQIADMQQWYAELKEDGTKLGAGQAFSVTGY
uniref:hypothetical protein n=1 Tax=Acidovorax sp. TaxID=1872122 RepID=UPI00260467A8